MTRRPARATALAVVLLGLIVGGCSGADEGPETAPQQESTGETAEEGATVEMRPTMHTRVSFGRVTGKLDGGYRKPLQNKVSTIVDRWFEDAYLGRFPRKGVGNAYAGFSPGARKQALDQPGIMSNRALSDRIETAVARKRKLVLDVVTDRNGNAIGVTARAQLEFVTTGEVERKDRVAGSLYLGRDRNKPAQWRVFGYDMRRVDPR